MNYKFNELEWIDFLKRNAPKGRDVLTGIGDDCAQVRLGQEKFLLKSDLFIENIHFNFKNISYETIGLRAVSRVLSDLASCGGTPKFLGISIGVAPYVNKECLKAIFKGVMLLSKKYNFYLVGGDTSRSVKLFLDVWAVGTAKTFIKRNTAKIGDYIFLTGKLGCRKFNENFVPRIKEAKYLSENFKINSMIDISDGFTLDLYRILKESQKGAILYKKNIPLVHGAADLYRGEDYELIFTVSKTEKNLKVLKKKFYFVGIVKPKAFGYKIEEDEKLNNLRIKGYTHKFKQ